MSHGNHCDKIGLPNGTTRSTGLFYFRSKCVYEIFKSNVQNMWSWHNCPHNWKTSQFIWTQL